TDATTAEIETTNGPATDATTAEIETTNGPATDATTTEIETTNGPDTTTDIESTTKGPDVVATTTEIEIAQGPSTHITTTTRSSPSSIPPIRMQTSSHGATATVGSDVMQSFTSRHPDKMKKDKCIQKTEEGVFFPETEVGLIVTTQCPQNYLGTVSRHCLKDKTWGSLDLNKCLRKGLGAIIDK
ncbi:unnamed protein product, partial [Lymnaea stagnalis]